MGKDLSKPETLESFREATMRMDNVYSRFSKICGLSDAEYWSLLMIYEGGATQSQISGQLFLSRQTLNSAFKQLRKKGLVRLEPYAENQRSKQAFLTDAGKEFVEKYVLQMHRLEEQAWKMMEREERAALTTLTQKFTDLLQQLLQNSAVPKAR